MTLLVIYLVGLLLGFFLSGFIAEDGADAVAGVFAVLIWPVSLPIFLIVLAGGLLRDWVEARG